MSQKNYQLNYNESYTGDLHHCDSIIEGYQYSMSLDRAFESLVSKLFFIYSENIECSGVSIRPTDNGSYKIFTCLQINFSAINVDFTFIDRSVQISNAFMM